ncbi:MAG: DUF2513 domain-containing protein, partial [Clostridia bacterium]
RDILLEVEDFTTLDKSLLYEPDDQDDGRFGQYDPDQIAYHVRQCALSNLICDYREFEDNSFLIGHLSPAGHALLADIRSDT